MMYQCTALAMLPSSSGDTGENKHCVYTTDCAIKNISAIAFPFWDPSQIYHYAPLSVNEDDFDCI